MPRKYQKKSSYWDKFDEKTEVAVSASDMSGQGFQPKLLGESFYQEVVHAATRVPSGGGTSSSISKRGTSGNVLRFNNIDRGLLPFSTTSDGVDAKDAILLCQKAYANIAVVRNAIDIAAEFSNTELFFEGGNAKSRSFFEKFWKKIRIWQLKDQHFREWFRSGNVFYFRIDGKFDANGLNTMSRVSEKGISTNRIPVRYVLLNPYEIVKDSTSAMTTPMFKKVLSQYEIERLKNPKDDRDRELFESLPEKAKKAIKLGGYTKEGIYMDLNPELLMYSFYKKQDYEPFAIPFAYPVLEDINSKMELKQIDQAIARTVQNVILLVKMGAEPAKGGVNATNLKAMQTLFESESVGRVLVSDWTTEAEFVIPDLTKVIGKEKYEILNQDIKEGLLNVFLGEDKYNGASAKIQFFLERLREARQAFINDIIQPEIDRISKEMGFRAAPTAKFSEIDLKDELQYIKVVTRLAELSILTPEQALDTMKRGRFPEPDELEEAQKKFVDHKSKGYYNPITGGVPVNEDGLPQSVDQDMSAPPKAASGTSGRPAGAKSNAAMYSRKDIQSVVYTIDSFMKGAEDFAKKKHGAKKLNKQQKESITELCQKIVASSLRQNWVEKLQACVNNPELIGDLKTMKEVEKEADTHLVDDYSAAILFHSAVK